MEDLIILLKVEKDIYIKYLKMMVNIMSMKVYIM